MFGDHARFTGAQFGDSAKFKGAQFGDQARFTGAQFGHFADFEQAHFGNYARFDGAQFDEMALFTNMRFGGKSQFRGAQFGNYARFDDTQFGDVADFDGRDFSSLRMVYGEKFETRKKWAEDRGIAPDKFLTITFSGASFQGEVSFSGRAFTGPTEFGVLPWPNVALLSRTTRNLRPVTFGAAPNFHNAKLHQDTSFEGANWPKARGSDSAARAYRTLKLAFSAQQAIREEQLFFRMEMREEALQIPRSNPRRWLYDAYWLFSNYGFSLWQPALAWLVSVALFAVLFALTGDVSTCWLSQPGCVFKGSVLEQSFLNALPLPGIEKLVEVPNSNVSSLLVALEKALALLWLFLLGLALRNRFKMK